MRLIGCTHIVGHRAHRPAVHVAASAARFLTPSRKTNPSRAPRQNNMQTQMRLTAQPVLAARGSRAQAPVCASSFMGSKLPAKGESVAELRGSVRRSCAPAAVEVSASLKDLRDRIGSVKNTKKITDAMKLVAAAKVRRAQAAVLGARPFSENLVKVLFAVNSRLAGEDVEDHPLASVRPVKSVLLAVLSGDRGLCGGYNNFVIKKTEARIRELADAGVKVKVVTIGKKCSSYFKRRPQYNLVKSFDMGNSPTTAEAQAIADEVFAEFVSEEVDKVELVYTRFVSLISSRPVVQTLLPLATSGQVCNVNGVCIDAKDDEVFALTTEEGKFAVKREAAPVDTSGAEFDAVITFEQDPNQILDALLPLYMNSQVLRSLQESIASELAARMTAMGAASDNAKSLAKALNLSYNRQRQAKITNEICELVAGAAAV